MRYFPDVNVLVALAWPQHIHHASAHAWFRSIAAQRWATCGVTESGFIRVSSNRRINPEARTPGEAAFVLQRMCGQGRHEFVADSVSLAASNDTLSRVAHTSANVTDAHLILIAESDGLTFVSFDRQAIGMASDLGVGHLHLTLK